MNTLDIIMNQQRRWAAQRELFPDDEGYLPSVQANLFAPLSPEAEKEFREGAGNEIDDLPGKRAKMRAVHSSSGLVCNLFDYWRTKDQGAISRALGISVSLIISVQFEAELPTGLRGTPPTLDLLVKASDKLAWGIESKFTEPFQQRESPPPFARSYFMSEVGLWTQRSLPRCQRLAEEINRGETIFTYLDAPQLLKHSLGIRTTYPEGRLLYLWFDPDTDESYCLAKEVQLFASRVDESLGFRAITHQKVFARLSAEIGADPKYVGYMQDRYFIGR